MAVAAQSTSILAEPLTLPCGHTIPNRIIKAAMTEQLSDEANRPTKELVRLYERWGQGGTGVLLTGNVMVDRRSLEGPRNVAVESDDDLAMLTHWAERAQANGSELWMQISHPGRQTFRGISEEVIAPSAVPIQKKSLKAMFTPPRAMSVADIHEMIGRFATTAQVAQKAGFRGVQIHGAHGYLHSQFLSPLVNQRDDDWGGTPEKRMRFLLETFRAVRAAVGSEFPISVKLNSADFQRGGFTEEDSMNVVRALESEGLDLLEISGGNYESPMMINSGEADKPRESTAQREAFFLDYAQKVRAVTKVPLMLTGGLRSVRVMEEVVESGSVECVGIARPLAVDPDFSRKVLEHQIDVSPPYRVNLGIKMFDDMLQSLWHQEQLHRMARGEEPDLRLGRMSTLAKGLWAIFAG